MLQRILEVAVTSRKVLSQHLPGATMNFNRVCSPLDMIQTRGHMIIEQKWSSAILCISGMHVHLHSASSFKITIL
jgi:hypothetical protein